MQNKSYIIYIYIYIIRQNKNTELTMNKLNGGKNGIQLNYIDPICHNPCQCHIVINSLIHSLILIQVFGTQII